MKERIESWPGGIAFALAAWAFAFPTSALQAQDRDAFEAMRSADMRLAAIGYRLSRAAAPMCDRLEPATGLQLHTLAQYAPGSREAIRTHFRMSGVVAAEGVIAGSPADRAGIRPDDVIVRIGAIAPPSVSPPDASTAVLESLYAQLSALPPQSGIEVIVQRDGRERSFQVQPEPACRTRYELRIADTFDARANGELVQLTSKYLQTGDPELLPAVVAHELAHNILRHRERLDAAGAEFGLASGFGRNVGLFRQTEIEADLLSVHILARAGYPLSIAGRFWREIGPQLLRGRIRSRSHPPLEDRVATVEAEAAKLAAAGPSASLPAFFAGRHAPLDGNWQPLLVRAR
ncbi:M48 family metallopeptidase [Sphingomonas sp. BT-65]|uniref:M48 family metallopeptidase n=1 Tax=Sphingomonas sp. BT-65 TaxID=2989821 RepID=UPI0022358A04|nr:M48 family metallopeptidase [Sphingomonas sp. BT-65]MCW4463474.1 M48 family metallopeptidase [Sphingomonas sp. BT-65]